MKKMNEKLLAGVLAISAMAASVFAPAAKAEVSASVGAANMYYWRGADLGAGDAAVWGDLNISGGGAYGGVWMTSGDAANGQEYDLYFGYGTEFGDFGVDVSYWTYSYPKTLVSPGDSAEIVTALSFGPATFTYYHGLSDLEDYSYFTLAVAAGDFAFKFGQHEDDRDPLAFTLLPDYSHLDITYAYNDKLSFTLGKVIDDDNGLQIDEAMFVVALTLPIE